MCLKSWDLKICVVCSLIQNSNFALNRWLQKSRKEHVNSNTHKGRVYSSNPHDVGLVLLPCKIKMKADISGIGKGQLFVARDLAKSEASWTVPVASSSGSSPHLMQMGFPGMRLARQGHHRWSVNKTAPGMWPVPWAPFKIALPLT